MIGLEEYKKALGEVVDKLSEKEILKVRQIQDELAESMYVLWVEQRKKNIEKFNSYINKPNKITYERK